MYKVVLPRSARYAKPYWRGGVGSVILLALAAGLALLQPWPFAYIIGSVLDPQHFHVPSWLSAVVGTSKWSLLWFAVGAMLAVTVIAQGVGVLQEYVNTKMYQRMVLDLRGEMFLHAQRLSAAYHDKQSTGDFIYRINQMADSLGSMLLAFPPMLQAVVTLGAMFYITYRLDPILSLISLSIIPFIYYSIGFYSNRILPRVWEVTGLEKRALSLSYEAIAMLPVVAAFGRERYEYRRWHKQSNAAVDARVGITVRQTVYSLVVQTVIAAGTAGVLGFGSYHVLKGNLSLTHLVVVMGYIAAVYAPLQDISGAIGQMNNDVYHVWMCYELLDMEPDVKEAPDAYELPPLTGEVTYENVTFAYEGRERTLENINFSVRPGERVAVLGPTGAGKTTLMGLLVRYHDSQMGRVLLDGHDITKVKLESLRSQISLVLQDPLLFSGSIADNIRYGKLDATMDEVVEAAKAANAHEFVSSLPEKYDTKLGERGSQLSGGERQRISIARAFLKGAPILILDEPTSAIDAKTEALILDALDRLMEGRTTFIISHRLSTIRNAQTLLVIEDGRLVEHGTREELLKRRGLFAQLWEAQTGYRPSMSRSRERTTDDVRIADLARMLADGTEQERGEVREELGAMDREELINWARDILRSGGHREASRAVVMAKELGMSDLVVEILERAAAASPDDRDVFIAAFESVAIDPDDVESLIAAVDPGRRAQVSTLLLELVGDRVETEHIEALEAAIVPGQGTDQPARRDESIPVAPPAPASPREETLAVAPDPVVVFVRALPDDPRRIGHRLLELSREGDVIPVVQILRGANRPLPDVREKARSALPQVWDVLVRSTAERRANVLSALGDESRDVIEEMALSHMSLSNPTEHEVALELAAHASSTRCNVEAVDSLRARNASVRAAAARVLAKSAPISAIPALAARLKDPDLEVRIEAVRALSAITANAALRPMFFALEDPDPTVRDLAADAIVRRAWPDLARRLAQRMAIADLLRRHTELAKRLNDRAQTAFNEVVGRRLPAGIDRPVWTDVDRGGTERLAIRPPSDISERISKSRFPEPVNSPTARRWTVTIARMIGGKTGLLVLRRALADPVPDIRRRAIRATRKVVHGPLAHQLLRPLADDPSPVVASEARRALRRLRRQSHGPVEAQQKQDTHAEARSA